jgi:hypothetical protein
MLRGSEPDAEVCDTVRRGLYIIDVNSVPIIQERPLPCCFRKLLLVTIPVQ